MTTLKDLCFGDSDAWVKNKKELSKITKHYKKEAKRFGKEFSKAVNNRGK